MLTLTLVGVDEDATRAAATRIDAPAKWLAPLAADLAVEGDVAALRAEADAALTGLPVDFCIQPSEGRRKALFVADMDSTIIGCECLDELADFAGLKAQIAAITERAMRGEIEFEGALRERVGKLKGLGLAALQQTYDERVRLNPGAAVLVRTMGAHGTRCVLVSGGFTFLTSPWPWATAPTTWT